MLNSAIEINAFLLSSVNASVKVRVNADARCEYTQKLKMEFIQNTKEIILGSDYRTPLKLPFNILKRLYSMMTYAFSFHPCNSVKKCSALISHQRRFLYCLFDVKTGAPSQNVPNMLENSKNR